MSNHLSSTPPTGPPEPEAASLVSVDVDADADLDPDLQTNVDGGSAAVHQLRDPELDDAPAFELSEAASADPSELVRSSSSRAVRAELTAELYQALRVTTDPAAREALVGRVVVVNMGLARTLAGRYRGRGLAQEDLEQVAYLALVRAAQRFDPAVRSDFRTYAVPCIRGEIRRHFRDSGWTVRPPRRVQEIQARVIATRDRLADSRGDAVGAAEIAEHLGESVRDVEEALMAEGCFHPVSLDAASDRSPDSQPLGELLRGDDSDMDLAETRMVLAPALRDLGERERRLLRLRYVTGMTQHQIARELGVTQTQISRMLQQTLHDMRGTIDFDEPEPEPDSSQGPQGSQGAQGA